MRSATSNVELSYLKWRQTILLLLVPKREASIFTRRGLTWVFGFVWIHRRCVLFARYELHQFIFHLYCPHRGHQISLLHCFLFSFETNFGVIFSLVWKRIRIIGTRFVEDPRVLAVIITNNIFYSHQRVFILILCKTSAKRLSTYGAQESGRAERVD